MINLLQPVVQIRANKKQVWDEIGYHTVTFEIRSAYQDRWILCLVMNLRHKCVPIPENQYSYRRISIENLAPNHNDSRLLTFKKQINK